MVRHKITETTCTYLASPKLDQCVQIPVLRQLVLLLYIHAYAQQRNYIHNIISTMQQ
jgi:hypothetical protein